MPDQEGKTLESSEKPAPESAEPRKESHKKVKEKSPSKAIVDSSESKKPANPQKVSKQEKTAANPNASEASKQVNENKGVEGSVKPDVETKSDGPHKDEKQPIKKAPVSNVKAPEKIEKDKAEEKEAAASDTKHSPRRPSKKVSNLGTKKSTDKEPPPGTKDLEETEEKQEPSTKETPQKEGKHSIKKASKSNVKAPEKTTKKEDLDREEEKQTDPEAKATPKHSSKKSSKAELKKTVDNQNDTKEEPSLEGKPSAAERRKSVGTHTSEQHHPHKKAPNPEKPMTPGVTEPNNPGNKKPTHDNTQVDSSSQQAPEKKEAALKQRRTSKKESKTTIDRQNPKHRKEPEQTKEHPEEIVEAHLEQKETGESVSKTEKDEKKPEEPDHDGPGKSAEPTGKPDKPSHGSRRHSRDIKGSKGTPDPAKSGKAEAAAAGGKSGPIHGESEFGNSGGHAESAVAETKAAPDPNQGTESKSSVHKQQAPKSTEHGQRATKSSDGKHQQNPKPDSKAKDSPKHPDGKPEQGTAHDEPPDPKTDKAAGNTAEVDPPEEPAGQPESAADIAASHEKPHQEQKPVPPEDSAQPKQGDQAHAGQVLVKTDSSAKAEQKAEEHHKGGKRKSKHEESRKEHSTKKSSRKHIKTDENAHDDKDAPEAAAPDSARPQEAGPSPPVGTTSSPKTAGDPLTGNEEKDTATKPVKKESRSNAKKGHDKTSKTKTPTKDHSTVPLSQTQAQKSHASTTKKAAENPKEEAEVPMEEPTVSGNLSPDSDGRIHKSVEFDLVRDKVSSPRSGASYQDPKYAEAATRIQSNVKGYLTRRHLTTSSDRLERLPFKDSMKSLVSAAEVKEKFKEEMVGENIRTSVASMTIAESDKEDVDESSSTLGRREAASADEMSANLLSPGDLEPKKKSKERASCPDVRMQRNSGSKRDSNASSIPTINFDGGAQEVAATKIQAVFRGFNIRRATFSGNTDERKSIDPEQAEYLRKLHEAMMNRNSEHVLDVSNQLKP